MIQLDYREHIQKSIDYIEEHLKDDVTLSDMAGAALYSSYHFIRIFRIVTGLTPYDYLKKRRISEIVKHIFIKGKSISSVAFEYGFNSEENFIRAFKEEHGVIPSEYKKAFVSLRLFEPLRFDETFLINSPQIISLPEFEIVGYYYPVRPGYNRVDIPKAWNHFNCIKLSVTLTSGLVCEDYGFCLLKFDKPFYFIGVRSEYVKNPPEDCQKLTVPAADYAEFNTPSADSFTFVSAIHQTWDEIYRNWFPQSGYVESDGFPFEVYNEQSRLYSEKIYMPIEMRKD